MMIKSRHKKTKLETLFGRLFQNRRDARNMRGSYEVSFETYVRRRAAITEKHKAKGRMLQIIARWILCEQI